LLKRKQRILELKKNRSAYKDAYESLERQLMRFSKPHLAPANPNPFKMINQSLTRKTL
jgi:hypothetical protein